MSPDFTALRRALSLGGAQGASRSSRLHPARFRPYPPARTPGHPGPLAWKLPEIPDRPAVFLLSRRSCRRNTRGCCPADSLEPDASVGSIGQDGGAECLAGVAANAIRPGRRIVHPSRFREGGG